MARAMKVSLRGMLDSQELVDRLHSVGLGTIKDLKNAIQHDEGADLAFVHRVAASANSCLL
jgi:hypothetical protein